MNIITIPNPILKTKLDPITDFSNMAQVGAEMEETAIRNNLVSLAANQIGFNGRIFVMNIAPMSEISSFISFINPVVKPVKDSGKSFDWEECGSIPNLACLVERWNRIVIGANSTDGSNFELTLNGYIARIAQHELNHLDGILMSDKARQRRFVK